MIIRKYGLLMYHTWYYYLVLEVRVPFPASALLYYCTLYGTSTKYRYYRLVAQVCCTPSTRMRNNCEPLCKSAIQHCTMANLGAISVLTIFSSVVCNVASVAVTDVCAPDQCVQFSDTLAASRSENQNANDIGLRRRSRGWNQGPC